MPVAIAKYISQNVDFTDMSVLYFYVKTVCNTPYNGHEVNLYIKIDEDIISNQFICNQDATYDWTPFYCIIPSGVTGTHLLTFEFSSVNGSISDYDVYLDDIKLLNGDNVLNGDFEQGLTYWSAGSYGSSGVCEISTTQVHNGTYSLKMSAGSNSGAELMSGIATNVSPTSAISFYMYISEYDEDHIESFAIELFDRGGGEFYYSQDLTAYLTNSGWQHIVIPLAKGGLNYTISELGISITLDRAIPS